MGALAADRSSPFIFQANTHSSLFNTVSPRIDHRHSKKPEAQTVVLGPEQDLDQAIEDLGLENATVLVLVGGADAMDCEPEYLQALFFEVLAPLAESLQTIVIDGGTDSGVMKLMGAARSEIQGTFPLLGIAAIDTVELPERPGNGGETAALEARHSHFLLVPGESWGDESPWIARVASLLSNSPRSLTLVINGGKVTLRDISFSIRERRPVLVFAGTGRTADRIAASLESNNADPEIRPLIASGLIQALEIKQDTAALIRALHRWFRG